jgi:hypothetical protein
MVPITLFSVPAVAGEVQLPDRESFVPLAHAGTLSQARGILRVWLLLLAFPDFDP